MVICSWSGLLFRTLCCINFCRPTPTPPLVTRMTCLPLLTRASSCSTRAPRRPRANLWSLPRVTTAVPTCRGRSDCLETEGRILCQDLSGLRGRQNFESSYRKEQPSLVTADINYCGQRLPDVCAECPARGIIAKIKELND